MNCNSDLSSMLDVSWDVCSSSIEESGPRFSRVNGAFKARLEAVGVLGSGFAPSMCSSLFPRRYIESQSKSPHAHRKITIQSEVLSGGMAGQGEKTTAETLWEPKLLLSPAGLAAHFRVPIASVSELKSN
ncbi:hypothetical protein EYF80_041458 [Liparis tanakae]|uniref:Uncharacterized protein n=1 Tax=Liparis tanakae TaxID=230148 RepID=A0A4Z2G5D7_9TELE|nr:hypothetical protein EYF80_041458 [Liparis tanakae]